MTDFDRLSSAWIEWTKRAGIVRASINSDCDDCIIMFSSDGGSVHLRVDNGWWIVDEVDDRGDRYNGTAKFSNFQLVEKFLIWRWLSTLRTVLGAESVGAQMYKLGYDGGVTLKPAENEWFTEMESDSGSAILSQPESTIFSHLISKSVDEIEEILEHGIKTEDPT